MRWIFPFLLCLAIACGDDSAAIDASVDVPSVDARMADTDSLADVNSEDGGPSDTSTEDADSEDASEASIAIHITASGAEFPHADLLSGQTARNTLAGVRSLSLHRSMADTDPLVLFRADGDDVEVGYVPGDNTVLTRVPAASLVAGNYTFARLVQTYARYEVDATLRRLDGSFEGVMSSFHVVADGTVVEGSTYDSGHYEFEFTSTDVSEEWTGENGVFPDISATAGAIGIVEDGEWVVYFPIDLEIIDSPMESGTLSVEVNMFESFRWTDLLVFGYEPSVFDVTDISFEPVVRFGGNSFELRTSFEG